MLSRLTQINDRWVLVFYGLPPYRLLALAGLWKEKKEVWFGRFKEVHFIFLQ